MFCILHVVFEAQYSGTMYMVDTLRTVSCKHVANGGYPTCRVLEE